MAESAELQAVEISAPRTPKDKSCLLDVIGRELVRANAARNDHGE